MGNKKSYAPLRCGRYISIFLSSVSTWQCSANERFCPRRLAFWGKLCAAALCAAVIMTAAGDGAYTKSNASSAIDQIQQKLEQLEAENKRRQQQIDALGGDIADNEEAIAIVSAQIDGINAQIAAHSELIYRKQELIEEKRAQIEAVELSIADKENEIELKKQRISELEAQNKNNLEKFAQLARAMYMTKSSDTIPVLNGSDDWYDFFVYKDVVKNISAQNVRFMEELQASIKAQEALINAMKDAIERLEQDKTDLRNEKAEYEAQEETLRREQNGLSAFAQEQTNYLYRLSAQNQQLRDKINENQHAMDETDDMIDKLNKELEAAIRAAQANNNSVGSYSTDDFRWPLDRQFKLITTRFEYDPARSGNHYGLDIGNAGIGGANVYAAQSGEVIYAKVNCYDNYGRPIGQKDYHGSGYGNYIIIDHGGGIATLYAHLNPTLLVAEGQFVNRGDVIGYVGSTGWSTGFHLHFETRVNTKAVDPEQYTYSDY